MKRITHLLAVVALAFCGSALAQGKKPNILIIWGDDIGYWNVSAYNQGMMGYKTRPTSTGSRRKACRKRT